MAAVMCAAAVTTSATAGGRARQLSRRVGAQSCDILDVTSAELIATKGLVPLPGQRLGAR